MHVEEELSGFSPEKETVLTIGVFDGVHMGHKHLISRLLKESAKKGYLSGVVTFRQHPQEMLVPKSRLPWLTDLTQRIQLLKNEGIEAIITLSFTPELAQLSAREFVNLLKKYIRMRGLVIGHDFALGQNREGNADTLRTLGQDIDFTVTVIPPVMINNEVISSTAIREALAAGDMPRVHRLVGRYFSLSGPVITGAGRGVGLGFPTANLDINSAQALPAEGVYVTRAYIDDSTYQSVTNIGRNPTFGGHERTVEVYLLDYHSDLYGRELKIDILERLRDEKKFDTAEELKKQIAEDIARGKAILNSGRD